MTHDAWQKLEQLFDQALDLDPAARAALLARLATEDPPLAAQLQRLLDQDDRRAAEPLADLVGAIATEAVPSPFIGRRIGVYRIERQIGQGGMGAVFEAVREDEAFSKRVALKIAPQAGLSGDFHRRFLEERRILAALEHPNIARILDGGSTPEGFPYFAMELVEGRQLLEDCTARALPLRGRVALFLEICAAVEYAHQNLVVHRDIKPANVLVDSGGRPRLLDFGIAKILAEGSEAARTVTSLGPATPDYCAPEQVRGEPITTRTDVYQLGLLLYELLSGARAQRADTTSPGAFERSICDAELTAPSLRVPGRASQRALTGDLDTVVLKAAAKDPARRYASVAELAADLRRWLDGRPVSARRDSSWYRARKFIARNRLAVTAAAAVTLALIAGIIASTWQARRAARRFEQVRGIARALMFDVQDAIQPLAASLPAQQLVVKTGLDYLNALSTEAAGDPELQLEIASGYLRIGEVQGRLIGPSLGKTDDARLSYERARSLVQPLVSRDPGHKPAGKLYADVERTLGDWHMRAGNVSEGVACFARAVTAMEQLHRRHPTDDAVTLQLADALSHQAREVSRTNEGAGISSAAARSVQLLEALQKKSPAMPGLDAALTAAYSGAGTAAFSEGRAAEAADYFLRNIPLREKMAAASPNDINLQRDLMIAYSKVGDAYWGFAGRSLGDRAKARPYFEKMAAVAERLLASDPANRNVRFDHAMSLMRLADSYDPPAPEGIAALERATRTFDANYADDPRNARMLRFSMEARQRLAPRYLAARRASDAESALRHGITLGDKAIAIDPRDPAYRSQQTRLALELAQHLASTGRRDEARTRLASVRDTLAWFRQNHDEDPIVQSLQARLAKVESTLR